VVQASDKIIVDASAQLQDVLLLAPKIEIKNNVKGTFQAFANTSITVGKNCTLNYPSALVVNKRVVQQQTNTNNRTPPSIAINSNTTIKGIVLYLDKNEKQQFNPQVKIESGVHIIGELYCAKNLEHKGIVIGGITTSNFIAMENGSIYQNHLYNGRINSNELSRKYAGLLLENKVRTKAISKWLY